MPALTQTDIRFVRDHAHPAESPNTDLVAAALACGYSLAGEDYAYHRAQNEDGTGHVVVWGLDGKRKVSFKPAFKEESLTFDEFRRRYEDRDWCEANPHHPISFLAAQRVQRRSLMTRLREILPLIAKRRGKRTLLIPPNISEEERARWEAELRK